MSRKSKKKYEIDMCSGSVLKKLLLFAVPLMFSSMLQLLFNAADIVIVGRFAGDNSLAAVGSNTALIGLMTNLFVGLSVGVNVLAARLYGAGEKEELNRAVHTAMLLSMISGVLLTVIGIFMAKKILIWMHAPEDVLELAAVYLRTYFFGMPAMMIYNFGSAVLRAVGDTKRPLYYLSAAGLINLLLNMLFVIVLHLDVFGVGLATVISQSIAAFLMVHCLLKEEGVLKLTPGNLRLDKKELLHILRVGIPAGVQNILYDMSNVVVQASINIFGAVVVAANSAAESIENFVLFGMMAFSQVILSFVGQNIGRGEMKRIGRGVLVGILCSVGAGLLLGGGVLIFGEQLLGLYTSSDDVVREGMIRLQLILLAYPLCGALDGLVSAMRGMGQAFIPTGITLLGVCGLRLIWMATVFQTAAFHRVETIYVVYPISWLVTLCAQFICFIVIKRKVTKVFAEANI
ncbi:MAG: MATE family efflux transporter [Lachnospiraceae bacterium]